WHEGGLIEGLAGRYAGWSARLLADALIMAIPGGLHLKFGVDLLTAQAVGSALVLLGLAGLAAWAAGGLWPRLPAAARLCAALTLLVALIGNARSARDLIYWLSAAFTHAVPGMLTSAVFLALFLPLLR